MTEPKTAEVKVALVPLNEGVFPNEFLDALNGYMTGGSGRCLEALESFNVKIAAAPSHIGEAAGMVAPAQSLPVGFADAIELAFAVVYRDGFGAVDDVIKDALDAAKANVFAFLSAPGSPAEKGEGEPVAWRVNHGGEVHFVVEDPSKHFLRPQDCVMPLYTHPASDQSDTERMRAAASKAYRACQSAWSCGEPPHRVKDMLDAMDALGVVLGEPGAALAEKEAGQ